MFDTKNKDEYFEDLIESGLASCFSIRVFKDNEKVFDFLKGKSSPKKDGEPISNKTRFNIGSVTKPVTASLIVKLIEMGILCMNDTVKKFIPEFKFNNITIYNLLTHTAGFNMGSISWPKHKSEKASYMNKIYSIDKLDYKTNEDSRYFTQGYSILLDIIERATNLTIEDFARKVIFDPLAMDKTTYDVEKLDEEEFILPYNHIDNRFYNEMRKTPATGDTGLYTNAEDLMKFVNLFLNDGIYEGKKIFMDATIDFMLTEITGNKFMKTPIFWMKGNKDAFGCFGDINSNYAVGHTGFSGCMMIVDPVYRIGAVILSNSTKLHSDWKNYKKIINVIMS